MCSRWEESRKFSLFLKTKVSAVNGRMILAYYHKLCLDLWPRGLWYHIGVSSACEFAKDSLSFQKKFATVEMTSVPHTQTK